MNITQQDNYAEEIIFDEQNNEIGRKALDGSTLSKEYDELEKKYAIVQYANDKNKRTILRNVTILKKY